MYISTQDGLYKFDLKTEKLDLIKHFESPLGFTKANNTFYLCDSQYGLFKIFENQTILLTNYENPDNVPISFCNSVTYSKEGNIYFSDTSSIKPLFDRKQYKVFSAIELSIASSTNSGRILKLTKDNKVKTVIKGIQTALGVCMSHDEEFLLYSIGSHYRIDKLFIKGPGKGIIDKVIQLPGVPNKISKGYDRGTYWVAISQPRSWFLDMIHPFPFLKKFYMMLPISSEPLGLIIKFDESGKILKTLHDMTGNFITEISSVFEYKDKLYIASTKNDYIGVYKL